MKLALAEPVLVGREHEVAKLESFLCSALEGKGKTVLISGEAGSGKTRLANEFLKKAKDKGVSTLTGWCLSNAAVPYFPFFEAFNAFFTSIDCEEPENGVTVSDWLKGPAQANTPQKRQTFSPQVWKDQTFAAVTKTLITMSSEKPVILFLDDVQWADSASLSLIHYIARAIRSEKVLLLATFRSEQVTCDADGKSSYLAETIRLMKREDLFEEINLSNLSQTNIRMLAQNMLGGNLQEEFTKNLSLESQGNALFVVESIRMLSERNALIQEKENWRLSNEQIGIPDKVKDIIVQRLSVLHRDQRRILDVASVIGERFDTELVAAVLDQDYLKVAEALDVISQATSLVLTAGTSYRFDHARSKESIYDELSIALKRGYHARVAEKMESSSQNSKPLFSDLAYHYAEAENTEKAVRYALAAGEDELAKWANAQAVRHFSYVLQNALKSQTKEKRIALEGLGDAYAASSMFTEAIKTFDQLAASETGLIRLRAIRKATDAAFRKGDEPDILFEYARKAEQLATYDRLEMARILNNRGRAFFWARRGSVETEIADYEAALKVFEEENSLADAAAALARSGCVSTIIEGKREEGLSKLARSIAIFKDLGDMRGEIWAILNFGYGLRLSGLFSEAKREYNRVLTLGEKIDAFDELAQASMWLGDLIELENPEAAIGYSLKAMEYSRKTDAHWIECLINSRLCTQYTRLGDLKHAEEHYRKIIDLPREMRQNAMIGISVNISERVYLAAKNSKWDELTAFHEKEFSNLKIPTGNRITAMSKCILELKFTGKFKELEAMQEKIRMLRAEVEERFGRSNVQFGVMVPHRVRINEEFEIRFDFVNVGRRTAKLLRIAGATPPELKKRILPPFCSLQNDSSLEIEGKEIEGFQTETFVLGLVPTTVGKCVLEPQILFSDDSGQPKTFSVQPITIVVQPAKPKYDTLPGRIPTGYEDLDGLLFGGIPEKSATILTAPSTDERELLIKRFIESGLAANETVFDVTTDTTRVTLSEPFRPNLFLFVCNPQVESTVQERTNIYKLKGVENLTEIDIALTKALRNLTASTTAVKRICIEIVSDALLQHHAINTRRWLNELLPTLKAKGFTILATVNPKMHSQEELEAILGLFEGEIRMTEKETAQGIGITLRIRKLINQRYSEKEISLNKEKL